MLSVTFINAALEPTLHVQNVQALPSQRNGEGEKLSIHAEGRLEASERHEKKLFSNRFSYEIDVLLNVKLVIQYADRLFTF
jgi:hypothetical protein